MLLEQAKTDGQYKPDCERMNDGTCYWNKTIDRRLSVLDSPIRSQFVK